MATLLYAVGFMACTLIFSLASVVLFQDQTSSLVMAIQLGAMLLSGFGAFFCLIQLISRLYARLSGQTQRVSHDTRNRRQDGAAFTAQSRPLEQSQFAQALKARRNLTYEDNQQQKKLHGQQMANRLKTERRDRQAKFERWPQERMSGYDDISRPNRRK